MPGEDAWVMRGVICAPRNLLYDGTAKEAYYDPFPIYTTDYNLFPQPGIDYAEVVNGQSTAIDSAPVEPGDYIASFTWGGATASVSFTIVDNHTHSFTYAASGDTITATCLAEGCKLPPSTEGGTDHVATLTIGAPTMTAYGQTGEGISAEATITDAKKIRGGAKVQYQTKSGDTYGEASETAPTGAGDHKASITLGTGNNTATAYVEYEIATPYPLWVGGTQVTSANAADVFGDGKVSYTPATTGGSGGLQLVGASTTPAKLTLNNYSYTGEGHVVYEGVNAAIYAEQDLTIDVTGTNTITQTSSTASGYGIYVDGKLTFSGSGKLTATATQNNYSSGINARSSLTIKGGTVEANGGNDGIYTYGDVKISGGKVTASGNNGYGINAPDHNVEISGGEVTATTQMVIMASTAARA